MPVMFKIVLFSGYVSFVLFLLNTLWGFVATFLDLTGLQGLACQLGVIDALNTFVSILMAGYLLRKTSIFLRI